MDLTLQNDPAEIGRPLTRLDEYGRSRGVSERTLRAVTLALHEHIVNIIHHGFEAGCRHSISARFRVLDGWMKGEIDDDGRPFNPLEYPPVDASLPLDERPLGGLGVHMIRNLMDRLEYQRGGERNRLVMWKAVG